MEENKDLGPEFIKTTYDGKEQWWLAEMNTQYSSLGNIMYSSGGDCKIHMVNEAIAKIKNEDEINFIPITEPTNDAIQSEAYHRGRFGDKNPMMYRKKEIPELKAKVYHVYYLPKSTYTVQYVDIGSRSALTPGQISQLHLWFDDQLRRAYTPELLAYLKEQNIKRYFHSLRIQVAEWRKGINKFEGLLNSIENNESKEKKNE